MVVVMEPKAPEEKIQNVISHLRDLGFDIHRSDGVTHTILGAVGDKTGIDLRQLEVLDGVREVVRISEPYMLASRSFKKENTVIRIGDVEIGGQEVIVAAGPCAVESREQIMTIAEAVRASGAKILRGGVPGIFASIPNPARYLLQTFSTLCQELTPSVKRPMVRNPYTKRKPLFLVKIGHAGMSFSLHKLKQQPIPLLPE